MSLCLGLWLLPCLSDFRAIGARLGIFPVIKFAGGALPYDFGDSPFQTTTLLGDDSVPQMKNSQTTPDLFTFLAYWVLGMMEKKTETPNNGE